MTRFSTRWLTEPVPLLEHRPRFVWLAPGIELAGFGTAVTFPPATGADRFHKLERMHRSYLETCEIEDETGLATAGPVLFASMTFSADSHGSRAAVPSMLAGRVDGRWFVTTINGADPAWLYHPSGSTRIESARPRYAGSSIPDLHWLESVSQAVDQIEAGQLEKVVLARDYAIWSKTTFDQRLLLTRLNRRFPSCYTFLVDDLIGASPELLVRKRGNQIESLTLAGSAARSEDPAKDLELATGLLGSDKDRREHQLAAASVRLSLEAVCERLLWDPEPVLMELANVRHLATRFRGCVPESVSALTLAGRLHPTAAVGGTPTPIALEAIADLEHMDRGRYAGPVGWMNRNGDGEFAIALRCAELAGARARLFAGAGIVAGSLPEAELEETRLKLGAMLDAFTR